MQIEDTILSVRHAELQDQSEKCDVDLCALDSTVQPIIESCTKEAIMVRVMFPHYFAVVSPVYHFSWQCAMKRSFTCVYSMWTQCLFFAQIAM